MNAARPLSDLVAMTGQRVVCSLCGLRVEPERVECAAVRSNVRAFKDEVFHVWRCPKCQTLHCLEVVDLGRYYEAYPIARTTIGPVRVGLANNLSRLTRRGFTPASRLLDYGCGWGVFLDFLRQSGYGNVAGYDPYSAITTFRNHELLRPAAFDYIVVQDVLEHVEDPRVLFRELDGYLKPGGYVLVGTPRADKISLKRHADYWLQLHQPYHLHIYTRAGLEQLGSEQGWQTVDFYDRPYYDTKVVGLNARALIKYQGFSDGTLDAIFEAVPERTLRRSPGFMFMAHFGYWFSRKAEMAALFRKPNTPTRTGAPSQ